MSHFIASFAGNFTKASFLGKGTVGGEKLIIMKIGKSVILATERGLLLR